jgi:Domain of unknown function (DUF5710)
MEYRSYLNVPFAEKDAAKVLGAKWDPVARKWYAPEGCDTEPFKAWLPVLEEGDQLRISAPLFVAESRTACWSCKETTPVIALAVEMLDGDGEPYISLLSNIEELPPDLSRLLAARYPFFKRRFSKTAKMMYMMNHCRCGAPLGDFYMHAEPGGSFCPTSPDEGRRILLRRLANSGCVVLKAAGYSISTDDFIGLYATRSAF